MGLKACCNFGGFSALGAVGIGGGMGAVGYYCTDDCGASKKGTANFLCSCFGAGATAGIGGTRCCNDSIKNLIKPSYFTLVSGGIGPISVGGGSGCFGVGYGAGTIASFFYCTCYFQPN